MDYAQIIRQRDEAQDARDRFRGLLEGALEAIDYYAAEGTELAEDQIWWRIWEALQEIPHD